MFGRGHEYKGCKISPMQLSILVLLRGRPMYGYEVLKELRDRFEGVWTPQTGSIYPALKRLEEHGLVSSEKREGTDYYSLTVEGDQWVLEKLRNSPRDIRFLTRYLSLLGDAAAEVNREGAEVPEGRFAVAFTGELDDDEVMSRKAERLRMARMRISQHLAMIDQELAELETNHADQDKRGSRRERKLKKTRELLASHSAMTDKEIDTDEYGQQGGRK